MKRKRITKS